MTVTHHHRLLGGSAVILRISLAADGAVEFWRCEDPATGAIVDMSNADKWWAVIEMKRAVERMSRGAA